MRYSEAKCGLQAELAETMGVDEYGWTSVRSSAASVDAQVMIIAGDTCAAIRDVDCNSFCGRGRTRNTYGDKYVATVVVYSLRRTEMEGDMRWIVHRETGVGNAVSWLRELLSSTDVSAVDWIRIDFGRGAKRSAYGRCWYLVRSSGKGYRMSVRVPGPFPWTMRRYSKPLYRNSDGTWPEVPAGCRLAGWCRDERNGNKWQRLVIGYHLATAQEAIAVGSHEVFHFLRHSRQIPGRNRENDAGEFALAQLAEFRRMAEDLRSD
jgi:hypothetical protein